MAKIYVASSWRNEIQPSVVEALRDADHDVYDFKNPEEGKGGFHWSQIDPEWELWSPEKYRDCLDHPIAQAGYECDFEHMLWADVFVGVMPFGRSASLEMGWAAGRNKKLFCSSKTGSPN